MTDEPGTEILAGIVAGRVIVTETGFRSAEPTEAFLALPDLLALPEPSESGPEAALRVDLGPGDDPEPLRPWLRHIALIRIGFPVFSDGRGFTLARSLRRMGYAGHLRAAGQLSSDQHRLARACGFDDIEIDAALAARQPEGDWRLPRGRAPGYLPLLR
jgi:uncharacterized protein (DUF934 family)